MAASVHPFASFPTAAPQQSDNTITLTQALARGSTADQLTAVANWNEQESHNQRRRKARARLKQQAEALREVADRLAVAQHMQMREAA